MALITANAQGNRSRIKASGMPPKGTFVATCIDIEDWLRHTRPKYDRPEETEIVDLTMFYFGFREKNGTLHVIRSRPMKISLHEKAALTAFITAWTTEAPQSGFDTALLIGRGAQITIIHSAANNGKIYANISTISPVMEALESSIIEVDAFSELLEPKALAAEEQDDIPF